MPQLFDQDAPSWTDPWALERWPTMHQRLVAVGATADEINDFEDQWLHDPEWPYEDKNRVYALGDGQLRRELLKTREVNRRNLETEADEARRIADERDVNEAEDVKVKAYEMSAWEPRAILEWVGHSTSRARAALDVEEEHPRPRAELIAALIRILR